jgi:NADPH-dependent glutamate synthase beta subunit-like oxidoreductase
MSIARIDSTLCNGCGTCIDSCPEDVIRLDSMPAGKEEIPPCTVACPAGVNIRRYMHVLKLGMIDEAAAVLRESLPMPAVTGRVCPHPCESECARKEVDQAVNINGIERFLGDYWLHEKAHRVRTIYAGKIAVIGSGPAGLACAYFLCRMGYPVTVFESEDVLGGMLRIGIPEYRLPRDILDAQIDYIRDMGVEFKTGVSIGRDIGLEELKSQYDSVFIAVGNQLSKQLDLEGSDLEGFLPGLDFLRKVHLKKDVIVKKRVVVIGGGNVAVNVALTALRLGAKEVHLVCLETTEEMPAYEEEIQQALDEGVTIHTSWGPKRILGKNGKVTGIELVHCSRVFDDNNAFSPSFDDQSTISLKADQVIFAIGQKPDLSLFPKNAITIDPVTLETGTPGVFAGGDAVSSEASSVVEAIAAGKRASVSIDCYFKGEDLKSEKHERSVQVRKPPRNGMFPWPRQETLLLPVSERADNFREVKLGFTEDTMNREARRCMTCGSEAVITYPEDCMVCLYCERDCPMHAIYVSPEKTVRPMLPWD